MTLGYYERVISELAPILLYWHQTLKRRFISTLGVLSNHNFLELMLIIFSNTTPDGFNKSLGFAQTLIKKGFEFFLGDRDVTFVFYLILVLLPVE